MAPKTVIPFLIFFAMVILGGALDRGRVGDPRVWVPAHAAAMAAIGWDSSPWCGLSIVF